MIDKFWAFMDSAKGFWSLIFGVVLGGVVYLRVVHKIIEKVIRRR